MPPIGVEPMASALLVPRSTTELKGLFVTMLSCPQVDVPKWIKHLDGIQAGWLMIYIEHPLAERKEQ